MTRPHALSRSRVDRGFTLIELLVVVIIVGVLASVAVPVYLSQKDKAAKGATAATMRNAHTLIIAAREESKKTLRGITGSGCSTCECRENPAIPMLKVSGDATFRNSRCGRQWTIVTSALANASGEPLPVVERLFTDGWGYPITVDENEDDPTNTGVCGVTQDQMFSAGPNHTLRAASGGTWDEPDDTMVRLTPIGYC